MKVNDIRDHAHEVVRKCAYFDRNVYHNIREMYDQMSRLQMACEEGLVILRQMQDRRVELMRMDGAEQPSLFAGE